MKDQGPRLVKQPMLKIIDNFTSLVSNYWQRTLQIDSDDTSLEIVPRTN